MRLHTFVNRIGRQIPEEEVEAWCKIKPSDVIQEMSLASAKSLFLSLTHEDRINDAAVHDRKLVEENSQLKNSLKLADKNKRVLQEEIKKLKTSAAVLAKERERHLTPWLSTWTRRRTR